MKIIANDKVPGASIIKRSLRVDLNPIITMSIITAITVVVVYIIANKTKACRSAPIKSAVNLFY